MTKYVLDTNLYIRAYRSHPDAEALRSFYRAHNPVTYLSSVVLHELLVGATTPARAREIREEIASAFHRTKRVVTPSGEAWTQAAEIVAQLGWSNALDRTSIPRGFINDVLIAASCREHGLTLVTENMKDFRRIRQRLTFDFVAPWPS